MEREDRTVDKKRTQNRNKIRDSVKLLKEVLKSPHCGLRDAKEIRLILIKLNTL